ncbi:hypothetical protein NEOLEDRAFT_1082725 [Neolentinus lepideus HHB14362 ss-1]|uniref:Uncharacterized protein n=1 Tax=Neolentinus lepideus HHB14362 ss-1 TaxID=1314782 RepID=A0A165W2X8_9AGAM|nr:hypothetical protein NEOLEDRAFT_1082725 [Neolentinus lepideus HHB14362 ss-1]
MSDPRFARLRTDPRFRKLKRKNAKVVVDDRFKSIFSDSKKKRKENGAGRSVDKYGRPVSDNQEQNNLRRFYRLENDDSPSVGPDYARGEVLLQSSDEEVDEGQEDDESDDDGIVTLGTDQHKPIRIPEDEEAEINLDENDYADLDAQAAQYSKTHAREEEGQDIPATRRLAVVNLDWDHVRAIHLYKIFSSLVSTTASSASGDRKSRNDVVRGKILNVRVYPSQFGKERMAKEEKEGPPVEVFKKNTAASDVELTEKDMIEVGGGQDYDEDALRKYQLDRLRYYYAIVECDTQQTASHIYNELQGTELEYSANVFDLSYVPDDMTFDDEHRDEASDEVNATYKGLDFVTDALRHSRVKLTWDEDDPERVRMTRRALSKKEIEEADFKAYIASSESESDNEGGPQDSKEHKSANRDKLRALLLGGGEELPEGWGVNDSKDVVDMEITFTPGLSESRDRKQEETTLEKYQRKMKEKRKKRKEESKEKAAEEKAPMQDDDFFASGSDGEQENGPVRSKTALSRLASTTEELSLLAVADDLSAAPRHFDMKAVVKSEKTKGKKKRSKKHFDECEDETQDNFQIDVNDERFTALHDDYNFAIDPSNPHFKKTKSMSALLEERSQRRKHRPLEANRAMPDADSVGKDRTLSSLVESVKRKSTVTVQSPVGKRRKT